MKKISFCSVLAAGLLALGAARGQSPIIVQPADAPSASPAARSAGLVAAPDSKNALQSLQDIQTLNEVTIKKQEAALATLDDLQKAAEELKIFSKRG